MGGVDRFAFPVADGERGKQVRVGRRIPALVDAVRDTAEQALLGLGGKETVEATAEVRGGDFLRIRRADGGDVARIGHAGLEERHLAVELHAFLLQGMGGNPQLRAGTEARHALVGEVVNGEQRWRALPAPVHVSGREASRPVMCVHQIRAPVNLRKIGGDVGSGQAEAGEADMVVRPVATVVGTIWAAFTLVEFRADQHVDHQAIGHVHASDLARWQRGVATQLADDVNRVFAVHHLRITGDQHPHIMQMGHGPGQGGGDVTEAAGLDQIGDFRSHKQHFFLVGILACYRSKRLGAGYVDLSAAGNTDGARFSKRLVSTLSLNIQCRTDHMYLPCVI